MELTERANLGLHSHVVDRVLSAAPGRSDAIVDIGCGTGALLARLRERGYTNLAGIDIAPPEGMDGVRFHAVDLDSPQLPFPDESVSLAIAVEVVEHLENPGAFFSELRRVLAPAGRVIITTPNVHSVEARLRLLLIGRLKQFDSNGDPTHIYPVFAFPFNRVIGRHGFSVAQCWGYPEDGTSPSSRRGLRLLAGLARLFGMRGSPDGDQFCVILERSAPAMAQHMDAKKAALTAHY